MTGVLPMYSVKSGSPISQLTADALSTDTRFHTSDLSVLEDGENMVTFVSATFERWETCKVVTKEAASGEGYFEVERSGTEHDSSEDGDALDWGTGTTFFRTLTGYDVNAMKNNIEISLTKALPVTKADGSTVNIPLHGTETGTLTQIASLEAAITELQGRMDPIVAALIFG